MELEHTKLTQEEAAKELLVKVDGKKWHAIRLAIVRREKGGKHWVYMIIQNPDNFDDKLEFMALRPAMINCWMALQIGEKRINQLRVEINGKNDIVTDVYQEEGDLTWIAVVLKDNDITISIERQSMVNAYYALRTNIEDMIEASLEAVEGFVNNML